MQIYHRRKMKKSEDKTKKRIISELWKKTEKDGNEYGILISEKKKLELDGDKNEISDKTWRKARWLLLDNPKAVFDFYHTHPEWDCPLSGDDVAIFLRYKNIRSMVAITEEHLYTITKTKQSIHINYKKRNEIIERHREYMLSKLRPLLAFGKHYHAEDCKEGLWDATKRLAKEYNFVCKEEKL